MRLLLRVFGTILIACALILVIVDGTRSLAANNLVLTPLAQTWSEMHAASFAGLQEFLDTRLFGPLLKPVVSLILGLPGAAVLGIPGLLLAWAGRSRREKLFVRQDQI